MSDSSEFYGDNGEEMVGRRNERSTIEFPYNDLEGAIVIARAIHDNAGGACSLDQLAAFLSLAPGSGGFRARIAPAKTFGLIDTDRGQASLTPLGDRILDPETESDARIEAFLTVPLYRALFDRLRSKLLPKADGMELLIAQLGVSSKQADRARQVFERSAAQAGFFSLGKDRLVEPVKRGRPVASSAAAEKPTMPLMSPPPQSAHSQRHPFIEGLLNKLPDPETEWSIKDRAKWLDAAVKIFDLLYKGDGEIQIVIQKQKDDVFN
jgi:hypothetical protein